jgi:hypothetical protein
MATTTPVPSPGPLNPIMTMERVLDAVHEKLVEAQGDMDKSTVPDDHTYYEGLYDAFNYVQSIMTKKEN